MIITGVEKLDFFILFFLPCDFQMTFLLMFHVYQSHVTYTTYCYNIVLVWEAFIE